MPQPTKLPHRDGKVLLARVMEHHGFSCQALAEALNRQGVPIAAKSLSNLINRGSFSADFFIECLRAMEVRTLFIPPAPRKRR
ncbi:MAG: helix-turn-helix domain-containing protein [Rhodocyclaceae bacterium]|jgi:hypothetical protein|nr:helix-turn-helix domain-containing protein [Rhodocyclaceae bacterium]